ncbi:hypothetical protein OCF84_21085 (plasmid) [Shewanella xiamenensis]|nr:hypothetical protein [Shewanella xiamenensis]WHF57753.1 hypothetical protein OCF84_21085 [Shewanella xiamenensis]
MVKYAICDSEHYPEDKINRSHFICEVLYSQSSSDIDIEPIYRQLIKIDDEFQYCSYCPSLDSLIHFEKGMIGPPNEYEKVDLPSEPFTLTDHCWEFGDKIGSYLFPKRSTNHREKGVRFGDEIMTNTLRMLDQAINILNGKFYENISLNDLIKEATVSLIKNELPISPELFKNLDIIAVNTYRELLRSGSEQIDLGVKYIKALMECNHEKQNYQSAIAVFTSFLLFDKNKVIQENCNSISEAIIKNGLDIIKISEDFNSIHNVALQDSISDFKRSLLYENLCEHQRSNALTEALNTYLNESNLGLDDKNQEVNSEAINNIFTI